MAKNITYKWASGFNGRIREHRVVAEMALGKPITPDIIVHHHNGNGKDNGRGNLVVCQDIAYHSLLHLRAKALNACGHANWIKCWVCKEYDDPNNIYVRPNTNEGHHRKCVNNYNKRGRSNGGK